MCSFVALTKKEIMNLNTKLFFTRFGIVFCLTLFLHLGLYWAIPNNILNLTLDFLFKTYIFLGILSIIHFYSLKYLFKKWSRYAGLFFTGLGLLKMVFSILFLLPYILPLNSQSVPFAINFMLVYFVILTFDVVFIIKSIQKNIDL